MATLLQFPDSRAKGRKRRRESMGAAGELALSRLGDEPKPENVVRMASVAAEQHERLDLLPLLVVAMLRSLPKDQQNRIFATLSYIEACNHDTRATAILDWLDEGRR